MTGWLVPLAGVRGPADAAPQPTVSVGMLVACLIVAGLLVTGLVTLVVFLVRRSRRTAG